MSVQDIREAEKINDLRYVCECVYFSEFDQICNYDEVITMSLKRFIHSEIASVAFAVDCRSLKVDVCVCVKMMQNIHDIISIYVFTGLRNQYWHRISTAEW